MTPRAIPPLKQRQIRRHGRWAALWKNVREDTLNVLTFKENGTTKGTRRILNIISGGTLTDDPANDEMELVISGGGGDAALTVQEEDGTPIDTAVTVIRVPNGTLTDNGVGDVSLGYAATAHTHPETDIVDGSLLVRLADANYIDLTDGGSTTLHTHAGGSGHTIKENGTGLTARTGLNFVDGLIATDDAGSDETDVNVDYATTAEIADVGAAEAAGTSPKVARGDHVHKRIDPEVVLIPLDDPAINATAFPDAVTVLKRDNTDKSIVSSTTETDFFVGEPGYTIPANTIGATGGLRLTLTGMVLNNAAGTITFRVRLGATIILASAAIDIENVATNKAKWVLVVWIHNTATNAQRCSAQLMISDITADNLIVTGASGTVENWIGLGYGTAAIDTTADAILRVTAQYSASSASLSWEKKTGILELFGVNTTSANKGFVPWAGATAVASYKAMAYSESAVGAAQTFEVFKNGVSLGTLTIPTGAPGPNRGDLSSWSVTPAQHERFTVQHTAGDKSGVKYVIALVRQ